MKHFSKVARELIGCLQKVDNDNYAEVIFLVSKSQNCPDSHTNWVEDFQYSRYGINGYGIMQKLFISPDSDCFGALVKLFLDPKTAARIHVYIFLLL
jgi:hypothetical protein